MVCVGEMVLSEDIGVDWSCLKQCLAIAYAVSVMVTSWLGGIWENCRGSGVAYLVLLEMTGAQDWITGRQEIPRNEAEFCYLV